MTCAEMDARIDALLDGELPEAERAEVEAHLAGCAACAALHADLVALRGRARRAPAEIAPPPAVWTALERRTTRDPGLVSRSPWRPWLLAAAAMLLVALSSAGTFLVLRGMDRGDLRPSTFDLRPAAALDPRLAALEADYQRATAELVRALEAEAALTPSVREALGRHLAVVDAAIAEARASVLERPADADAGGMLLAAYRQKLDLLERATRLGSES
jgi:predicted anti-sigma-YlaC factor YlaD